MKRDTYMQGSKAHYPQTEKIEAAKYLASVLRLYVKDQASDGAVRQAYDLWVRARA